MAFLSLLAVARMTFHPGSMVVVVPGLSGPYQLEKSDPGATPANPVGLARGQEGKKAYCQKSQVKKQQRCWREQPHLAHLVIGEDWTILSFSLP